MNKLMPTYVRILFVLFSAWFLGLLGGCATREKLALADISEQIALATPVSYKKTAISGIKWEYIALPGIYYAERKDADGIYFYGPGRSIVEITEVYKNVPRLKIGGIYVPNNKSQPVQMVYAFENTPTTTNDLNQYIQDRTVMTTAMPALHPGVGAGANIAGNVVAAGLISAMLQASEGEITRVTIEDLASSDIIRRARGPKPTKPEVELSNIAK